MKSHHCGQFSKDEESIKTFETFRDKVHISTLACKLLFSLKYENMLTKTFNRTINFQISNSKEVKKKKKMKNNLRARFGSEKFSIINITYFSRDFLIDRDSNAIVGVSISQKMRD